jgi:tetratricopeptide (TPR) repeat protein
MMIIAFFSLLIISGSSFGQVMQPVNILLNEAAAYYENGEEEKAFRAYYKTLEQHPVNYEALWNLSLLYTKKGHYQEQDSQRTYYLNKARDIAILSLEVHPDRPRSHYVYGISTATLVDKMPNSAERIQLLWDIKKHADIAAELDPSYAPVWHLLGVWHSKLGNISRAERFAARMLYGKLPEGASLQKAEEYLKKAIRLEPREILFQVDLAQHYQETGQSSRAVPFLENALAMQVVSESDRHYQQDARQRLSDIR